MKLSLFNIFAINLQSSQQYFDFIIVVAFVVDIENILCFKNCATIMKIISRNNYITNPN